MRKAPPRTRSVRPTRGRKDVPWIATVSSDSRGSGSSGTATGLAGRAGRGSARMSRAASRASSVRTVSARETSLASTAASLSSIAFSVTFPGASDSVPRPIRERGRLFLPWREKLHQNPEDDERQDHQDQGRQEALLRRERHLIRRVAEEALREELAADDDVPAHRQDPNERQAPRDRIDPLPGSVGQLDKLGHRQEADRTDRPDADLEDDLRRVKARMDHEV